MKKKLMAATMVFALCAMASSAFASQGVTGQIKTNVGTPSNVSISNAVNSNVANFGATAAVSEISTAEKAKQLGITLDELMKYYTKYYQLNVNKPNKIMTQAEMAKKQAEQKKSPIYQLIQQWEQKQMMQVINKK